MMLMKMSSLKRIFEENDDFPKEQEEAFQTQFAGERKPKRKQID